MLCRILYRKEGKRFRLIIILSLLCHLLPRNFHSLGSEEKSSTRTSVNVNIFVQHHKPQESMLGHLLKAIMQFAQCDIVTNQQMYSFTDGLCFSFQKGGCLFGDFF